MTYDQAAVSIMLDSSLSPAARQRKLTALSARADRALGRRCPFCGAGPDAIEDNGAHHAEVTYLCTACGQQWDGAEV